MGMANIHCELFDAEKGVEIIVRLWSSPSITAIHDGFSQTFGKIHIGCVAAMFFNIKNVAFYCILAEMCFGCVLWSPPTYFSPLLDCT